MKWWPLNFDYPSRAELSLPRSVFLRCAEKTFFLFRALSRPVKIRFQLRPDRERIDKDAKVLQKVILSKVKKAAFLTYLSIHILLKRSMSKVILVFSFQRKFMFEYHQIFFEQKTTFVLQFYCAMTKLCWRFNALKRYVNRIFWIYQTYSHQDLIFIKKVLFWIQHFWQ